MDGVPERIRTYGLREVGEAIANRIAFLNGREPSHAIDNPALADYLINGG